jgi:hypothetical protein
MFLRLTHIQKKGLLARIESLLEFGNGDGVHSKEGDWEIGG